MWIWMTLFWGTLTLTPGMKRLVLKQTWTVWRKLVQNWDRTSLDDESDESEQQDEPYDDNDKGYRLEDGSADSTGEEDTADDLVETMVERIGYNAIWKLHLWFTDRMQYSAEMATGRVPLYGYVNMYVCMHVCVYVCMPAEKEKQQGSSSKTAWKQQQTNRNTEATPQEKSSNKTDKEQKHSS